MATSKRTVGARKATPGVRWVAVRVPKWAKHGARLRAERERRGIERIACAKAAGIEPNYLSQIERGATALSRYELRMALATALGMRLDAFVALWEGHPVDQGSVKKRHVKKPTAGRGDPQWGTRQGAPSGET